ncbi:hypothetical protein GCM10007047_07700 [Cerasicoccus arenae]|uniref:Uncharacterized protein n=1 Tax=Cerasicoccus arenae TaxID=424488 RepID=A0A8J3D9S4_9BACT|nr:hypothetical protein GCM10007047_07700 [Cerasicoccus arenae]
MPFFTTDESYAKKIPLVFVHLVEVIIEHFVSLSFKSELASNHDIILTINLRGADDIYRRIC